MRPTAFAMRGSKAPATWAKSSSAVLAAIEAAALATLRRSSNAAYIAATLSRLAE